MSNNKKCFIVCPIGSENSEIRKDSDQLLKHIITPVCNKLGYDVCRADIINDNDTITQTIIEQLQESDLVIADITGNNPNVFYELGYRQATNKPVIQMVKSDINSMPFDVSSIRTIRYTLNDPDKLTETKESLQKTIRSIKEKELLTNSIQSQTIKNDINPLTLIADKLTNIEYSISLLNDLISKKDKETVQTIIETLTASKGSSIEDQFMMRFVEQIFQDPTKVTDIIKLGQQFQQFQQK
ncbi:MAG: nucleoside 2-deoxyribosyltransferase [Vallitalea sp.]|jgi:nucleoside 2-deoxyribosyltransferase|nr:nucleoside 2-deoxyribosyltransferase [Vallitalea sp.]